jgi:hypothetical protein
MLFILIGFLVYHHFLCQVVTLIIRVVTLVMFGSAPREPCAGATCSGYEYSTLRDLRDPWVNQLKELLHLMLSEMHTQLRND